jgi:hypothetical protein
MPALPSSQVHYYTSHKCGRAACRLVKNEVFTLIHLFHKHSDTILPLEYLIWKLPAILGRGTKSAPSIFNRASRCTWVFDILASAHILLHEWPIVLYAAPVSRDNCSSIVCITRSHVSLLKFCLVKSTSIVHETPLQTSHWIFGIGPASWATNQNNLQTSTGPPVTESQPSRTTRSEW